MSIKEITLYNFGQNKMTRKNKFFFLQIKMAGKNTWDQS